MKVLSLPRFVQTLFFAACVLFVGQYRGYSQNNAAPFAIGFYYPTNGQVFTGPTNVGIHAWVVDSNVVQTVQYFNGTSSLGIVTNKNNVLLTNTSTSPFELNWSNVPPGTYTLTAVGTDSTGATATSGPVTITVKAPPPIPFVVGWMSPTNNEVCTAPTNLYVHAWVTDSNVVKTMEYLVGTNILVIKTNTGTTLFTNSTSGNPFAFTWTNPPPGVYSFTAIATDSTGATATSGPVTVTINPPPSVPFTVKFYYPTNGATFTAPTNIPVYATVTDSNAVQTVQFFAGTTSIGIATNTNATPANATTLGIHWNVPPGIYALTAVATDNTGATATSGIVNITVNSPQPPPPVPFVVGWYYPTNGEVFTGPTNIGLHASVTDSNIVRTMQYFSGTNLIGIVTNTNDVVLTNTSSANPFFFEWINVPPGTYSLTAVATDSAGATATSGVVNITVNSPAPPPPVPFTVKFYYPRNGATFTAPTNIPVYATVTDSNVVQTVQFFAGTNIIGIATKNPPAPANATNTFELLWNNVPPGTYMLTAVATDSSGATATSGVVNITVNPPLPPPPVPFVVGWYYPTNGQVFAGPTNIGLHASVTDSNVVHTMQYFSGTNLIGIVTNTNNLVLTNTTSANPFFFEWMNAQPGIYTLTAVATDSAGATATSGPVTITVNSPPPPPPVPFAVRFYYPTNGATYTAPTNIPLYVIVTDSNLVQTIQYFAGTNALGTVTNTTAKSTANSSGTAFELLWSNVPPGVYTLSAIATDNTGATATSGPITITVNSPPPPPPVKFLVGWNNPTNGETYVNPSVVYLHAWVTDSNVVSTMQYFAGPNLLATVTNTGTTPFTNTSTGNPFAFFWKAPPAGTYTLTAVATDITGATATSGPITITVFTNTPPPVPPIVTIYAPDPTAIEGTNSLGVTNTATFLVRRDSATNTTLTVYYTIGGTASNGVDYITIPDNVTLQPGQRYGTIIINPLEDNDPPTNRYETVTLALRLPPGASNSVPLPYSIGNPSKAGAVILEATNSLPTTKPLIQTFADSSVFVSLPAPNGMNYTLQFSTNFATWTSVCTNTVLKGSAQFVDPNGLITPGAAYRIVPAAGPAVY